MNNFPPKKLPNGQWMMTRRDNQRQGSGMVGGVENFNDWEIHQLASYDGKGRPEEPYWYTLPDGKNIVGLIRDSVRFRGAAEAAPFPCPNPVTRGSRLVRVSQHSENTTHLFTDRLQCPTEVRPHDACTQSQ